jgi:hypothetical protein
MEDPMRIMIVALATLFTTAVAFPFAAHAEDTVIIKKGDNGHHYGWRHRHHRDKKVVVIKERDRHRHSHYRSTTTGSGVGVGVGVHVGD